MRNLAIIPARSGSKGVKDKNIKMLDGKPLIAYTIEAAIGSGMFIEVCVSTDSEEYANIARRYGANVPFLRSREYSTDSASSWDVVRETLDKYGRNDIKFDSVALLQPTSPLRTSEDIINAYNLYYDRQAKSVVSVCEAEHSPLWINTLPQDLSLQNFMNEEARKRRQELPAYYRVNGAIYIIDVLHLENQGFLYDAESYAYIMSQEKSVDIDTEMDFKVAELFLGNVKRGDV